MWMMQCSLGNYVGQISEANKLFAS